MSDDPSALPQILTVLLTAGFFGWMFWAASNKRRRGLEREPVEDEPEGTPYRAFSVEFDRTAWGREVPDLLREADYGLPPARPLKVPTWKARLAAVERLATTAEPAFAECTTRLVSTLELMRGKAAVMLLIDQSGSMHDNILSVAPNMRWLSHAFAVNNVPLAIAGFTTLGWRGGASRRHWIAAGRPSRPGRLCALLHIWYRGFDGLLAPEDLQAMAHPVVLRENVDGEAIDWAISELLQRSEPIKLLIVLSDGAPVDDSTITENGNSFLYRHLIKIIRETEQAGLVRLGAIGIEHRVNEYYARSADATDLTKLPFALVDVIEQLMQSTTLESS